MVRTLDFHSKNAGSIPAGSKKKKIELLRTSKVVYKLTYISLIPLSLANLQVSRTVNLPQKLLVKKSFLIFLWLNYLTLGNNSVVKIKFRTFPTKTKLTTIPKAPMAHKKNSKEQFLTKIYQYKLLLTSSVNLKSITVPLNLLKQLKLSVGTNFFFLSSFQVSFPILKRQVLKVHMKRFCFYPFFQKLQFHFFLHTLPCDH